MSNTPTTSYIWTTARYMSTSTQTEAEMSDNGVIAGVAVCCILALGLTYIAVILLLAKRRHKQLTMRSSGTRDKSSMAFELPPGILENDDPDHEATTNGVTPSGAEVENSQGGSSTRISIEEARPSLPEKTGATDNAMEEDVYLIPKSDRQEVNENIPEDEEDVYENAPDTGNGGQNKSDGNTDDDIYSVPRNLGGITEDDVHSSSRYPGQSADDEMYSVPRHLGGSTDDEMYSAPRNPALPQKGVSNTGFSGDKDSDDDSDLNTDDVYEEPSSMPVKLDLSASNEQETYINYFVESTASLNKLDGP